MEAPKYNSLASGGALSSNSQSQNEVRNSEGQLLCRWVIQATGHYCNECFDSGADLFHHITELHIGRKSLGNLSLYCAWNNCGHVTEKRDHIVSHARVHVPSFKPHSCPDCDKAFSRSQDLKKHLKTHGKSPLLSSAASPQTQYNSPPAKQNSNLRLQIPTNYSQKIAIAPYSAPISPGHIQHQQQLMYQHQMALQNQNIYGLVSGHPFAASVPALSGPNTSSTDTSLKRSRDTSVNFQPIAPLPSLNAAAPPVAQTMNVQQSSKAGKEEMDLLISDFIGSIKRKKVAPEYNEEMAATLDAIAEFVIPSISIPNNYSNVDAPITPVFDADTDMSSFLADASKTRDALASNVNSPTELNEVNSFLTQLYENLQAAPVVNEADPSGQESEGMEDTSFLDEFLRSSSVEFESTVSNQMKAVRKSQLTTKASTQSFLFDPEEFGTTYPHSAVEDRMKSLEFASLSESELDRFFEESENKNGKNIVNKDLRMDLLKKGMEKLAIQNQEEIKNKNKHFADNSEIEVKRNTRGRYPSNLLVAQPQDTVEKKPADYVLSDPSSIVRQLNKGHFKSDSMSKQKTIASEQSSGNSSMQASASRKPTLGSPLDRTKSGKYYTASPSSSLSPTRRLSKGSLLASKRKPLTRSQSQPILPSADILAQKRMREYHGYVISMIMKQLERIWQDAKKAEA